MPKATSYRIVLRGRRGFAELRSARTFEIWYGRRKVISAHAFAPRQKKVSTRRNYLERLIQEIESERLKTLAKQKRQREKKKAEKLKAEKLKLQREKRKLRKSQKEAEQKRLARKVVREIKEQPEDERPYPDEDYEMMDKAAKYIPREVPDFKNSWQEEPLTLKNATIKDVTIVPIKPKGNYYHKELVEKIITTNRQTELLNLTILDFTLKEEYIVPLVLENFVEAAKRAMALMLFHIFDFYRETKNSTDAYILRIKYTYQPKGDGPEYSQGISLARTEIKDQEHMISLFIWTMRRFIGLSQQPGAFKKNYLMGETTIFLTGFTLESVIYDTP